MTCMVNYKERREKADRALVLHEQGLGITRGHDQARAFIEQCLERFEMPSWDGKPTEATAERGRDV